jgi:hypothetical protein
MDFQRAAELQALLEGVPLPATRDDLVAYASATDAGAAAELAALPERDYDRLDAVGEALVGAQSKLPAAVPLPKPESGEPPGGPSYLQPFPQDTGEVRAEAPPDNPPGDALEEQSKAQRRQAAMQER